MNLNSEETRTSCLTVFGPVFREEGGVDVMHVDYASLEYVSADQIIVTDCKAKI